MADLDPKALEAARDTLFDHGYDGAYQVLDEHLAIAIRAYLAALPKGEPVAWLSQKGVELLSEPHPKIRAIVQKTADDEFNIPLFAAPPAGDER